MANSVWEKVEITDDDGIKREAVAPVIISASRSTDIPAYFSRWFIHRLRRGYIKWINPFNQKAQYVSFNKTRVIVFWSKNPKPLIRYLPEIDRKKINYYFQYTLNDYEQENLEPNVPTLEKRISTFKELSNLIGKQRVIWRFDPLFLSDEINIASLINKIENIGDQLHDYTEKLVISFADISIYKKVMMNLRRENIRYLEFSQQQMRELAERLMQINRKWNLQIATCAETISLSEYGIEHNKCIDDELMIREFRDDERLMDFLGYEPGLFGEQIRPNMKDKGQRKACGCIVSKDIGQYNTCNHLCVYCYANTSRKTVAKNLENHDYRSDSIV